MLNHAKSAVVDNEDNPRALKNSDEKNSIIDEADNEEDSDEESKELVSKNNK